MEKRWKSIVEIAPSCPRCASSNTKFCYYNNYSLSQPRYFCKGCRRYWTKGGSLRNVPVGGGCRKNRRSRSVKLHGRRERSSLTTTTSSHDSNDTSYNGDHSGSQAGSDIDLAVVFANYLNQKPNQIDQEANNSYNMNACGGNIAEEAELIEGFVSCPQEEKIEEVMTGNEIGEFGLQNLVGRDEIEQDVFWSDPPVNFSCQPMAHLQEIETFPPMNNLVNEIWSSFDSFAAEVFLSS